MAKHGISVNLPQDTYDLMMRGDIGRVPHAKYEISTDRLKILAKIALMKSDMTKPHATT